MGSRPECLLPRDALDREHKAGDPHRAVEREYDQLLLAVEIARDELIVEPGHKAARDGLTDGTRSEVSVPVAPMFAWYPKRTTSPGSSKSSSNLTR